MALTGRGATVILAALLLLPAAAPAHDGAELALRLKAAFLFNFAKFVQWPAAKFAGPDSAIEICVLEPDPFGVVLEETVRAKHIGGRPLRVRRSFYAEELRSCHLVYSAQADLRVLDDQFGRVTGAGVMTVHEGTAAIRRGVARLYLDGSRMRFEINTAAAEAEGLQLSSKLLSVARVVHHY